VAKEGIGPGTGCALVAPQMISHEAGGAVPEDVSDVLICYPFWACDRRNNPQANLVTP
jgi:hypothetical protein